MSKNLEDRLALVSLLITSDVQRNLSAIADAVERAHASECRLVCFPECALTGLVDAEDYEADIKLAADYTQDWWEGEEKWVYAQQITKIGPTSFIINWYTKNEREIASNIPPPFLIIYGSIDPQAHRPIDL